VSFLIPVIFFNTSLKGRIEKNRTSPLGFAPSVADYGANQFTLRQPIKKKP